MVSRDLCRDREWPQYDVSGLVSSGVAVGGVLGIGSGWKVAVGSVRAVTVGEDDEEGSIVQRMQRRSSRADGGLREVSVGRVVSQCRWKVLCELI